ncbi:MAG: hypothetical protein ACREOF_01135 [Gemmatimonadales bacterium]
MRRLVPTLALSAAAIAGTVGCGGRAEPGDDVEPQPDRNEPVPLTVTNNYRLDVVVFVYHDGELTRVGTATAASASTFSLAPWMLGHSRSIRLFADPVGSNESARTELLYIQPGQYIDWRLESQLNRSSVSVY